MANVRLDRVTLVHPMGDMGDRAIQGISTFIESDEWRMEANFHHGSVGDVSVFRNTSFPSPVEPTWKWYAGVPTANIKTYRLAENLPELTTYGEPKAKAEATLAGTAGASADDVGAGGRDVAVAPAGPGPRSLRP